MGTFRDGQPRTSTSTFSQLPSSDPRHRIPELCTFLSGSLVVQPLRETVWPLGIVARGSLEAAGFDVCAPRHSLILSSIVELRQPLFRCHIPLSLFFLLLFSLSLSHTHTHTQTHKHTLIHARTHARTHIHTHTRTH